MVWYGDGKAGEARLGQDDQGEARRDTAGQDRHGWRAKAGSVAARRDTAGKDRWCTNWQYVDRHGRCGMAGQAWRGMNWHGLARPDRVRHGRSGWARTGAMRPDETRQAR